MHRTTLVPTGRFCMLERERDKGGREGGKEGGRERERERESAPGKILLTNWQEIV